MNPRILRKWDSLPGMMSTADGLIGYADTMARRELARHGHCQPQWIVVRPDSAYLVATPFVDGTEKAFFVAWMAAAFQKDQKVERYAFLCEAWLTEFDLAAPGKPSSRRDALMINIEERSGSNLFRAYYVSGRGRRKILVEPREGFDGFDGQMTGLFLS